MVKLLEGMLGLWSRGFDREDVQIEDAGTSLA